MTQYMKILGLRVRDQVTQFEGTVTSIGFDLYGCVQCVVTSEVKDGKSGDQQWFDHKRLFIRDYTPVMEVPTFGVVAGPDQKPKFPEGRS